jgi:glycosyltransferase involved in cell wall biosynthesis
MTIIFIFFSLIYMILMLYIGEKFASIPLEELNPENTAQSALSVLIPFRNEQNNLQSLVTSLKKLYYPKASVEFIFINDHSEDESLNQLNSLLTDFPFNYLVLSNTADEIGKKAALTKAVKTARFENIVTTDADCEFNQNWLLAIDTCIQNAQLNLMLGPVGYIQNNTAGIIDTYQLIENSGLVAIAAVAAKTRRPFLANGANLAYKKSVFLEVNGYAGNENIASGDDEFLLQKFMAVDIDKIGFLKNSAAMVTTKTQNSLKSVFWQRVRWASKTRHYQKKETFVLQTIVALIYLGFLINFGISGFFVALLPIAFKVIADYVFYIRIKDFFEFNLPLLDIILVSLLQLFFIPIIGLFALFGKYSWKGRAY